MSAYLNTRLHQTLRPQGRVQRSRFRRGTNLSLFYWLGRFRINIDSAIITAFIIAVIVISYGVYSMVTYIEYKKQMQFSTDQYINEIVVPYEAKIDQLQQRVLELEARAVEIIHVRKLFPSRHFRIRGGTQEDREKFRNKIDSTFSM